MICPFKGKIYEDPALSRILEDPRIPGSQDARIPGSQEPRIPGGLQKIPRSCEKCTSLPPDDHNTSITIGFIRASVKFLNPALFLT